MLAALIMIGLLLIFPAFAIVTLLLGARREAGA
jgi:hypothetical protein